VYVRDDRPWAGGEASLRPNLRTVREKTQDQLDLQALHRVRSRLVSRRTATIKPDPGLSDRAGHRGALGGHALRTSLFPIVEQRKDEISPRMHDIIIGLYEDWLWLDERIETITREITALSEREAACRRISWSVLRHDRAFDAPGDQRTAI
jgi:transposase